MGFTAFSHLESISHSSLLRTGTCVFFREAGFTVSSETPASKVVSLLHIATGLLVLRK